MALRNPKFDRKINSYRAGTSIKSIAEKLGVSTSVLRKAFKTRGVKLRASSDRWLTTKNDREVIKLMYATGDYKMQELACAFGLVSYVSISQIVKNRRRKRQKYKPRAPQPAIKLCLYRGCDREVTNGYCRDVHMRLERSARKKDKQVAENALIIY